MIRFEEAAVFYNVLLQYTVREACRAAGVWEKDLSLSQITQAELQKFFEMVLFITIYALGCVSTGPELQSCRYLLRRRLSETLVNRWQHLRWLKKIPSHKRKYASSI